MVTTIQYFGAGFEFLIAAFLIFFLCWAYFKWKVSNLLVFGLGIPGVCILIFLGLDTLFGWISFD